MILASFGGRLQMKIKFNCTYCNRETYRQLSEFKKAINHFCSRECKEQYQKDKLIYVNCTFCNKKIHISKYQLKTHPHHFCNRECFRRWKIGKKRPDMIGNTFRKGFDAWNKGKKMNLEYRKKVSEGNKKRFQENPDSFIRYHFKPTPSPELSYLLGVRYGDGSLCLSNKWYMFRLGATDKEFVEEFRRCACILLDKKSMPKISQYNGKKTHYKDMYHCNITSKKLYEFLSKPLEEHKYFVGKHPSEFIRGFFDSEGSFSLVSCTHLRACNTNYRLITYIKSLLEELGIFLNLYIEKRRKPYKAIYNLGTGKKQEIADFKDKIGFTIERKQNLLLKYLEAV